MFKKSKWESIKLFFIKYSPFVSKKLSIWYLKQNGYKIKDEQGKSV